MSKYKGMPDLQESLTEVGFSLHQGFLDGSTYNLCDWYACRRVKQEAPLCACNNNSVQIVVMPYLANYPNGTRAESVEVELRALASHGEWWSMRCYGLSPETLKISLNDIEERLVAAWKAVNF